MRGWLVAPLTSPYSRYRVLSQTPVQGTREARRNSTVTTVSQVREDNKQLGQQLATKPSFDRARRRPRRFRRSHGVPTRTDSSDTIQASD